MQFCLLIAVCPVLWEFSILLSQIAVFTNVPYFVAVPTPSNFPVSWVSVYPSVITSLSKVILLVVIILVVTFVSFITKFLFLAPWLCLFRQFIFVYLNHVNRAGWRIGVMGSVPSPWFEVTCCSYSFLKIFVKFRTWEGNYHFVYIGIFRSIEKSVQARPNAIRGVDVRFFERDFWLRWPQDT